MTAAKPAKPKKPVHQAKYTAAQNKAYNAWIKSHPLKKAAAKAPAAKGAARGHAKPAKARKASAALALDVIWPLAMNDELGTCGAAAMAASAGVNVSDEWAAAREALSLPELIEDALAYGVSGVMLEQAEMACEDCAWAIPGLVVGLELPDGSSHAAMTLGHGMMASWGACVPMRGIVEEAWLLSWGGHRL